MARKKKKESIIPMFIALAVLMASLVFVIVVYLGGCSDGLPTYNDSFFTPESEIASQITQTSTENSEPTSSEPPQEVSSQIDSEPSSEAAPQSEVSSKNNSSVSSHTSSNEEVELWEVNTVTKGSKKYPYYIAVNREQRATTRCRTRRSSAPADCRIRRAW